MKKILCILACVFTLFATENEDLKAIGVGVDTNRDVALKKAIRQGVESAVGFRLKSDQKILSKSLKGKNVDSKGTNESFYANKKGISDSISSDVMADVSSYKILEDELKNGKYHIKVEVQAKKINREYDLAKMNSKRRTLAVLGGSSADFMDADSEKLSSDMAHHIISALTNSRRFRVLDRDTPDIYEAEKELIQSEDVNPDEIAKLGKVLGADYFVLFDLANIKQLQNQSNHSSIISKKSSSKQLKFSVTLDYRIFVMATREIKFADTINVEFSPNSSLKDSKGLYVEVLRQVANELSSRVVESIYPPRVYSANAHEIAIGQALNVGDEYECYELGDMIKDVYTGEEIDFVEIPVGLVQIVRSNNKVSYAKVLKGEVRRGDLCRKATNLDGTYKRDGVGGNDGVVKVNDNGGVVLPF